MSQNLKPIEIARDWLKKEREDVNGPAAKWPDDVRDRYHRDLGLLACFVEECWPKEPEQSCSKCANLRHWSSNDDAMNVLGYCALAEDPSPIEVEFRCSAFKGATQPMPPLDASRCRKCPKCGCLHLWKANHKGMCIKCEHEDFEAYRSRELTRKRCPRCGRGHALPEAMCEECASWLSKRPVTDGPEVAQFQTKGTRTKEECARMMEDVRKLWSPDPN